MLIKRMQYKALIIVVLFLSAITNVWGQSLTKHLPFESLEAITAENGVNTGSISIEPGLLGNAVSMSASDSLCFPASTILNTAQGTLQFWMKQPRDSGGIWEVTDVGIGKLWGGYRLKTQTTDTINFELQDSPGVSNRITFNWVANPDWHFFVFNWRQTSVRTEMTIYVDSVASSRIAIIGKANLTTNSKFCLGRYGTRGNIRAVFDELKTYDYLRTASEIQSDFLALFNGCPSYQYLWRNPINGADINRDGSVTKIDALLILSAIVSGQQFDFTQCPNGRLPTLFYDAFADNLLLESDAQAVVNVFNQPLPVEERITLASLRLRAHGDVNQDGALDSKDITVILNQSGSTQEIFTNGDVNGDGLVNDTDLFIARRYMSSEGDFSATLPRFIEPRQLSPN